MKLVRYVVIFLWAFFALIAPPLSSASRSATSSSSALSSKQQKTASLKPATNQPQPHEQASRKEEQQHTSPQNTVPDDAIISNIIITGNKQVNIDAILNKIPFRRGEKFDSTKTRFLIQSLYSLGHFRQIELKAALLDAHTIDLYIIVTEKRRLREVKFEGNSHLSKTEINKKIDFSKVHAVDEEELKTYAAIIKQLYVDKGYHFVDIQTTLVSEGNDAVAVFKMTEGKASVVRKITFAGNTHINDKKLRNILYTREDWLLGIMDGSGLYHPDALEMDKQAIETFYQNNGFLTAYVTHIDTVIDEKTKDFYITFNIKEGERYTIADIKAFGNELMTEEEILRGLPIKPGDLYNKSILIKSVELLKTLWGNHGYIFADVDPATQVDEDAKTISLTLYTDLGSKVHLNRINIIGNKKTRDKTIRRQILLEEGEPLTTKHMELSKGRVESLGLFDRRNGVNWKINRLADDLCDLDLILKEVRTGKFTFGVNVGGDSNDIANAFHKARVNFGFADTNLMGYGIQYDADATFGSGELSGHMNIISPYLFDQPISGALSFVGSSISYDDLSTIVQDAVSERRLGASTAVGFVVPYTRDVQAHGQFGIENLDYRVQPKAKQGYFPAEEEQEVQAILNRRFGIANKLVNNAPASALTFAWFAASLSEDLRNHPMHPSHGYQWNLQTKLGFPVNQSSFGFIKLDGDVAWYTPIIGEIDLILCLHSHMGIVHPFNNHNIPYRELFHIGGTASVRGFNFGQISPTWRSTSHPELFNASLGGTKAFWFNAELIFPIKPDFSIVGAVFYDGGAGWDTPDTSCISAARLRNNNFNYRHAVGVSVRITTPMPIQIDWGFKLDRNRKANESAQEIHFTGIHSF